MIPISSLHIDKKLRITFVDEAFMPSADIYAATVLLESTEIRVPVTLGENGRVMLEKLSKASGWDIEEDETGILLSGPLSTSEKRAAYIKESNDPGPVVIVESSPDETALPAKKRVTKVEKREEKPARPVAAPVSVEARSYSTLKAIFFKGSPEGQLNSVFKTRLENPRKVEEYRKALEAGECVLPPIFKGSEDKLKELGITR